MRVEKEEKEEQSKEARREKRAPSLGQVKSRAEEE
jgi:hypothetical protein